MLTFTTAKKSGYRQRTWDNAGADVTIAFAFDFNTAGEKLTKKAVLFQKRSYIGVSLEGFEENFYWNVSFVVKRLNRMVEYGKPELTLNIAGNGIYTCAKHGSNQAKVDAKLFMFLAAVVKHKEARYKFTLIRSGGQTGVDEAGIKAALRLSIPALVHAPDDWVFRGEDGKDISSETHFKERFLDT